MPAVRSPRSPTVRAAAPAAVLVAAVLLLGLNLRGPIVAVSPVLDTLSADLGIGAATAGLLTSLPVLCFGLATLLAAALLARAGLGRGVSVSLVVLIAGIVLRSVDGPWRCSPNSSSSGLRSRSGTSPCRSDRDLSHRSGPVLGAYTAALNVGSMLTLSLTVPLAERDRLAGSPGVLGRAGVRRTRGLDVCLPSSLPADDPQAVGPTSRTPMTVRSRRRTWLRRPEVWWLTVAFSGQAFAYYAVTAWLLLLRDEPECPRRRGPGARRSSRSRRSSGPSGCRFSCGALSTARVVLIIAGCGSTLPVGLLVVPSWWLCVRDHGCAGRRPGGLRARRAHRARPHRELARVRAGPGRRVRRGRDRPNGDGSRARGNGRMDRPLLVVLGAIALLAVAPRRPRVSILIRLVRGAHPGLRWGTRPHGPDRRRCAMDVWIIWLMLAAVLGIAELFTLSAALGLLGGRRGDGDRRRVRRAGGCAVGGVRRERRRQHLAGAARRPAPPAPASGTAAGGRAVRRTAEVAT